VATLAQVLLQEGKIAEALTYFDQSADLARSESELVNALSYAEAARTQLDLTEKFPHLAAKIMSLQAGVPR
jgi:import receptor subunit TOM70